MIPQKIIEEVRKGNWFIHTQTKPYIIFALGVYSSRERRRKNLFKLRNRKIFVPFLHHPESCCIRERDFAKIKQDSSSAEGVSRIKHQPHWHTLTLESVKKEIVYRYRLLNLFFRPRRTLERGKAVMTFDGNSKWSRISTASFYIWNCLTAA